MRKESKERSESAEWEVITHNTLITQQNVLRPNTDGRLGVPLLSRRERLRRSLDLPDTRDYASPKAPGPRPDRGNYEGIAQLDRALPANPEEWRESFLQWLDSACAFHPRVFGGVAALHDAYCEWEIASGDVPCNQDTFERLLAELGFLMGEVEGTLLVSGLALRDDVEAAGL
jgi:hypothetical protein